MTRDDRCPLRIDALGIVAEPVDRKPNAWSGFARKAHRLDPWLLVAVTRDETLDEVSVRLVTKTCSVSGRAFESLEDAYADARIEAEHWSPRMHELLRRVEEHARVNAVETAEEGWS